VKQAPGVCVVSALNYHPVMWCVSKCPDVSPCLYPVHAFRSLQLYIAYASPIHMCPGVRCGGWGQYTVLPLGESGCCSLLPVSCACIQVSASHLVSESPVSAVSYHHPVTWRVCLQVSGCGVVGAVYRPTSGRVRLLFPDGEWHEWPMGSNSDVAALSWSSPVRSGNTTTTYTLPSPRTDATAAMQMSPTLYMLIYGRCHAVHAHLW
jgi:hypothetical protein